ncbi:helix-turn-helix domain-containing protein [Pseudonocardia kunmingensis]|nr:helix-turn-helix transcriptional regulator [Pseudonocardia kunmingensis]
MVGSALVRRHIGRRFVALRTQAALTQEQAANALQRARATLGRIEDGDERVRFRDVDVRAMLDLYGANSQEREMLLALTAETRNGRKKSWWHDYTESDLPAWFGLYVSLEDSAQTISQYEAELIPGLLQTRSYAKQINSMPPGYTDEEEIERRVHVRLERQSLLTRPRAPHLTAILNEAVLHRPVGGEAVMAEQLDHLLEVTQQASVSIRILPWSAGVHGGMGASAFALLDFPADPRTGEPLEPSLVYADTLTGAMYLNKADEVGAYRLVWDDLQKRALDEAKSRKMISAASKGFSGA